ncbi:TIGR03749 family integrating conjugative element protein [Pseudomonas aeruginosa]|uniref:TIGR03749 family integrating conjugative element protein n=1 Tax=Pseudomonas aeruginosa TaxID=287 RepID=UPI00053DEBBF|nr:TIGR03749 family integrating conjugative element protein [Pseudomonas aeruginosa]WCV81027.1 TIGR03749 family integrating conjugative element protein [Pseudomonas aeruginosa]HBO0859749.1 TIGR03749 family integrating conjugative element protein [Pseudomonas aeruginosa]HCE6879301.1 TIGR03749 family integrating conjugative element protein [Pseudomonas aeruginosa]HDR2971107.1 TIGR03749 family integrating conjugative element protein [Pseudomonas aeruginosa]
MKHRVLTWLLVLTMLAAPVARAVEILRWERLPLAVPLVVGQERIVFIDRNVRVGVPASVGDRLRVQSAGGAVYLRASEPIEPTRLQLQDADSGALILLDIAAQPASDGALALEPVRIVEIDTPSRRYGQAQTDSGETADPDTQGAAQPPRRETPVPVVLTRYAAQHLYAPLRTVEPVPGVMRVNLRRDLQLDTLLPTVPVHAAALASWRLDDQWVTAVRLTNTSGALLALDPRALQGDFLTATFQHDALGPRGTPEDTTVLYLVTRGRGLAQSLLPAIQRFDPAVHLPGTADGHVTEEADHAQ